ncbi:cyanophycinase [Fibrella sp. HMF5036]|uniref:Cyanophycinase n=2 Tax=Fibrella aquatilis TaxID=2817059 RepID=A0A939JYS4_9BACT|nr:cyanophycinase [Fibrella aquatilis]
MLSFVLLACTVLVTCGQKTPDPAPVAPSLPKGPTTWLTGDAADVTKATTPGLVLTGGGTDVDEAMRWLLKKSGGGDVVVLRASGSSGYNSYLFSELGEAVNSVETILLNSREWVNDEATVQKIRNAEALFIAGGDQADYVNYWKGSKVAEAINYLINTKKVPVGGTSAGCAILGQLYYPALNQSLTAAEGLSDPYHPNLMLGRNDFINAPFLGNTITDTHFAERSRQGRLVAFLARIRTDWNVTGRGIGVSEKTAVCIDHTGMAAVFGSGKAYFVIPAATTNPEQCTLGKPLTWLANKKALRVDVIQGTTQGTDTYDLNTWVGSGRSPVTFWYVDRGVLN